MGDGETLKEIKTPDVKIPDELSGVKVWAFVHSSDFSSALSPVALMAGSESRIKKIKIAGHDLLFEDGKNEYDVTLYLSADKFPIKVLAYPYDLSSRITVGDITGNDTSFTVSSTSADGSSTSGYTVNLKAYKVDSASLVGLSYDNKPVSGFAPDVSEYTVAVEQKNLPEITAEAFDSESEITITQPDSLPGTGFIHVEAKDGKTSDYSIKFNQIKESSVTYQSHIRTTGGWHSIDQQSYLNVYTKQQEIYGTISTALVGYMLFTLPFTDKDKIVSISLTASVKNSIDSQFPATLSYYQCGDSNFIDKTTYVDDNTGIRKFGTETANKNYMNRYKGLDDRTEDYLLGRMDNIPDSGAQVSKTAEFDISKIILNERGEFVVIVKKEKPNTTEASLLEKQTYIYTPTLTVKYIVE